VRVLVTGHDGYVGACLVPLLQEHAHSVTGLDRGLFASSGTGDSVARPDRAMMVDIRDVTADHLVDIDAVVHLAGLSNDPLGDLNPALTMAVNRDGTIRLAEAARRAGVRRFVFTSSCSVYGSQGDTWIDETSACDPLTPYAASKLEAEAALRDLAGADLCPTVMRCATAYGSSPRLRGDLVVNNLVGYGVATGRVLVKSDGQAWRPLVHVRDLARALVAVLEAPRAVSDNEVFNLGATPDNVRIDELAELVAREIGGAPVERTTHPFTDPRSYRVNCDKLASLIPEAVPIGDLGSAVVELADTFRRIGLTAESLEGPRFQRQREVQRLQADGVLDDDLRWTDTR
jgi:nucleoside-diphosphate-sugar epimerase